MDILEIRKKAKGLKENQPEPEAAEAETPEAAVPEGVAAAPETVPSAGAPAAEEPVQAAPGPEAREAEPAPRKVKRARKGRKAAVVAVEAPPPLPLEQDLMPPEAPLAEAEAAVFGDDGAWAAPELEAEAPPVAAPERLPGPPAAPSAREASPRLGTDADRPVQEDDTVEYLSFMLADEEYAVRVEDVKEIIRYQETTQVPRTPDYVMGIISLRGVIIPIFDIRQRLGLTRKERGRTTRIIVVSDGGSPQGVLVDKVTGVARLAGVEVEPPPAVIGGVEADYIEGVGRIGERLLILFNVSRVLSMEQGS